MAEIVTSIGSKLAEYLVAPISQGATYLFCFKQFIGGVDKAKQELEAKLEDVKKRKEEADRKTKEIMPSVKKWLDDVNAILEEVQKLQQELEGGRNKCFNVSLRYSLAKRMENKAKQMIYLKQNSSFEPFSQLIQLPGIPDFSSKEFMDFNSRKSTYDRLLEAIIDGKNKMVGLYGIGGSGKTTLAKKVGKKVDELKLFDKVIIAVVSKPPNILNIQQEIAEQIGLQFKEAIQSNRAQRLSEGLKNKKILIILDDVWEYLRLEDIGIPTVGGCHILLTTRLQDVCVSMDCESKIELPLLPEEEAWSLFKMRANITNVSRNEFDSIGRKIVDECKGLPIAIVTVGRTLKGKGIHAWRSTLERLLHPPPLDIEDDLKNPYVILKVSYDNLSSQLAKSLFILCSMFPEDHEIHIEDLIRFGKGTLKLGE
ncbi:disease resistance protein RPS5-like [Neltuma alba]|uniref:disease resistance protein RPS5-like n=1 Tax=Neltuma alba TaxID=207710 RepID=UPI0010A534BB|nr:disease resistance protein RPS5-like [Prosopis alba]